MPSYETPVTAAADEILDFAWAVAALLIGVVIAALAWADVPTVVPFVLVPVAAIPFVLVVVPRLAAAWLGYDLAAFDDGDRSSDRTDRRW